MVHRWRISMDVKEVKDRYKGNRIPCVVLDVDRSYVYNNTNRQCKND